ncbi:MAG: hypothetical protein AAF420_12295, partial [Pseudomonadota bacterium]
LPRNNSLSCVTLDSVETAVCISCTRNALISVGAYQQGADSEIDLAILMHPRINAFLVQDMHTAVSTESSVTQLSELLRGNEGQSSVAPSAEELSDASAQ